MADEKTFLIRLAAENKQATADIRTVKDELKDLDATAKGVNSSSVDKLTDSFAAQKQRMDDLRQSQKAFRVELESTVDEIEKERAAFENVKGGGSGPSDNGIRNVQGLRRTGGALNQLGLTEAGRGVQIAGDIAQLGKFKDIISGLSPSVLGAGIAIGAFTVALDLYTKAQKDAEAAANEAIAGRQKAVELLATATRDEQQQALNRLDIQRKNNEAVAADANQLFGNLREGIKQEFGPAALAAEDLAATTGKAAGAFQAAHDSADKANQSLGNTATEMSVLEKATGLTVQTVDQAAAAEERLSLARGYGARVQAQAADALQLLNLAQTGSEKSVRDLIRTKENEIKIDGFYKKFIEDDLAVLDKTSEAYKSGKAAADAFQSTIDRDTEALKGLNSTVLDHAKLNDAAAQAVKDQDAAEKDIDHVKKEATDDEIKRQTDLQAIGDRTAESYRKLADSFKQANDEADIAAQQQSDKTGRTRADEDVKNAEQLRFKLSQIDDDITEATIKAAEDRKDAIAKAEREFSRSSALAIQNRDAVALAAADQKKTDDLADADKAYDKEAKQAEKNAEKKRKQLQSEFDEEQKLLKAQRASADRETEISRQQDTDKRKRQYQTQQDNLQSSARAEIAARNNAYVKQLSDLSAYLKSQETNTQGYYGTILQYANLVKHDIDAILNGGGSSSSSVPSTSPTPTPHNIPTIPRPGHPVPTPDFDAGYVYGGTTGRGAGGITIPINVKGMGKNDILKTVNDHLSNELDKAGW
jgi:hypothetical protein